MCQDLNEIYIPISKLRAKPRMTRGKKWKHKTYFAWVEELVTLARAQGFFELAPQHEVVFYVPFLAKMKKPERETLTGKNAAHQRTPDLDNLWKALNDSLLPHSDRGDSMVWAGIPIKIWSEKAGIYIKNLSPDDPRIWAIVERANNFKEKR